MNENRKTPTADGMKARQEYLRKMAVSLAVVGTTATLTLMGLLLMIYTLLYLLVALNYIPYGLFNKDLPALEIRMFIAVLVLILSPALVFLSHSAYRDRLAKAQEIAYVPSVREQIAALSADEVLLRGSDEPVASPEELLRAASTRRDRPAEVLLRSCGAALEVEAQQRVGGMRE